MIRRLLLPVLLLLSDFFLLTSSSILKTQNAQNLNAGEVCIQSNKCKSKCCRRDPYNCESHCSELGAEGSLCHTQTFLGLYNECPCQPDLTCVFSKNEKSFRIIYGHCKKMVKKKPIQKSIF